MIDFRNVVMATFVVLVFSGCSAKEFNEGVEGITEDVSKLFEVRE